MLVLIVTGGIGSGKSEVCRIMSRMGLDVQYDADSRVKSLYTEHPTLLIDIEEVLKCSLRDGEGNFLPARLAERIFSDRKELEMVEGLVFPALIEDFRSFCSTVHDRDVIVFESATVLEKPQFDGFGDITVLVDAPFETRLHRACERDAAAKEVVLARMNNQELMNALSEGHADPRIDAVVMNDGTLEDLVVSVKKTVADLLKDRGISRNI